MPRLTSSQILPAARRGGGPPQSGGGGADLRVSRIAAEGAVEIRSKRAVMVPRMTLERFDEIMRLRTVLEPMTALAALPHIDAARLRDIRAPASG